MTIRPATAADAGAIGEVYVAAWRSTYADILPARLLATMSAPRLARRYRADIEAGRHPILVAEHDSQVVGFCSGAVVRAPGLADAEVETLYVLDDHRDRGLGRALLQHAAADLAQAGCGSLFLWVLRENPSRWFYERLGGRPVRQATTDLAGQTLDQVAYLWNPIARLITPHGQDRRANPD